MIKRFTELNKLIDTLGTTQVAVDSRD